MPAVDRAPPAVAEAPPEESATPEWSLDLNASNSALVAQLFGASADEATATGLLEGETLAMLDAQAANVPAEAADSPPDAPAPKMPSGRLGRVFKDNQTDVAEAELKFSANQQADLAKFQANWRANRGRYERVAAKAGVPPVLVAALHYREASMDFGTYLHQGDPLGKRAVNVPKDIPLFTNWEDAAVHALNLKSGVRDDLGMTAETKDEAAMTTFAEAYNGLGYDDRGLPSPYAFAGTDQYSSGMYVSDGKFSGQARDRRLGVLPLVRGVEGASEAGRSVESTPDVAWASVRDGQLLERGTQGPEVEALQVRLNAAGQKVAVDRSFGPGTLRAVMAFQAAAGLPADGVVGPATAAALDRAPGQDDGVNPEWARVLDGKLALSVGARGEAVRHAQERLVAHDAPTGTDGQFGPRTKRAVRTFQDAEGLGDDGVIGKKTAAALDA